MDISQSNRSYPIHEDDGALMESFAIPDGINFQSKPDCILDFGYRGMFANCRNDTKRKKRTRGQGLVEFAIILPVLILFIMIIFDLGRMAYYYSAIHNASREGARYAAIHHRTATATDIATATRQLVAGLDNSLLTITSSYPTEDEVRVTVTYQFKTATPIISMLQGSMDNTILLTSRATMQLE